MAAGVQKKDLVRETTKSESLAVGSQRASQSEVRASQAAPACAARSGFEWIGIWGPASPLDVCGFARFPPNCCASRGSLAHMIFSGSGPLLPRCLGACLPVPWDLLCRRTVLGPPWHLNFRTPRTVACKVNHNTALWHIGGGPTAACLGWDKKQ